MVNRDYSLSHSRGTDIRISVITVRFLLYYPHVYSMKNTKMLQKNGEK